MYKNIVIDGTNNVGKSTLVAKLLQRLKGWKAEHMSAESPRSVDFYNASLENCERIIFDRHCISEAVYPELTGRASEVSPEQIIKIVNEHPDTLFVILRADLTFISKAYKNKSEEINWDYTTQERQLFDNISNKICKNKNVLLFDIPHENTEALDYAANDIVYKI